MEKQYGTIDGHPAVWITGHEAWWRPDKTWVKIDSVDASFNGNPMRRDDFVAKFPGILDDLPMV